MVRMAVLVFVHHRLLRLLLACIFYADIFSSIVRCTLLYWAAVSMAEVHPVLLIPQTHIFFFYNLG